MSTVVTIIKKEKESKTDHLKNAFVLVIKSLEFLKNIKNPINSRDEPYIFFLKIRKNLK